MARSSVNADFMRIAGEVLYAMSRPKGVVRNHINIVRRYNKGDMALIQCFECGREISDRQQFVLVVVAGFVVYA